MGITDRQLLVLQQVAAGNHTCRGIAQALGMRSNHGAYDHLRTLRKKGCLTWRAMRTGITLTDKGLRALGPCCEALVRAKATFAGEGDQIVLAGMLVSFCPFCGRPQPRP